MTEITALDDKTIAKIAAGEVVERPASVVKELVENSLDADASRVDVDVVAGGTEEITVSDDGTGMTEQEAKTAIEQHTTSKIRSIEDLEGGISTLGFRGEALHTIGAISRMTITTRPREGDDVGTELYVVGGELEDVAPAGRAAGTTVEIEDLFFNTPARRKYLKQTDTEFAHVNRVVTRYALANPDVAVSLTHGDNEVFATSGRGDRLETILSVYGRPVAESMIEVQASPEGPVEDVSGYVSDPETTRSGSEYVSTYVNGRYVREGLLRDAVVEAYGNQLAADRFPFAVLFLEVPPDTVDVNVHPRKMEVRFDNDQAVQEAIETAVESALLDHGLIRTSAPRGRSAPDETTVTPDNAEGPASGETPGGDDMEIAEESSGGAGRAGSEATGPGEVETIGETQQGGSSSEKPPEKVEERSDESSPGGDLSGSAPSTGARTEEGTRRAGTGDQSHGSIGEAMEPAQRETQGSDQERQERESSIRNAMTQAGLTDTDPDLEFDTLPPLRVLGQVKDTFVVAESPDGLVLIDQHAADERVNYERLAREFAEQPETQRLVEPVELDVTPQEASLFAAAEPELAELGFDAHREGNTVVVEAVPAVFAETLSPSLITDVLGSFLESGSERDVVASAADALLADMACYPSITGNTSLRDGDVLELLRALENCENPYACPHGRPVLIEVSEKELEARFERDYPGHTTRRPE